MIPSSSVPRIAALGAFAALALVACQTAPAAAPAANGDAMSLQAETDAFARDAAIAAFYAQRCAGEGVALADGTPEAAALAFEARMMAAGYDQSQITAATAAVDTAAAGQGAVAYLQARGMGSGQGDAALCDSARAERAQDTAVGRLLTAR